MRIDKYLAEKGFAESRQKAKGLIAGGFVLLNGKVVTKDSIEVGDSDEIEITGTDLPYVSRGGLKLEGAKKAFGLDFAHKIACDVGASTGGFTDVLLRGGADRVYAIDCGRGQLHKSLLADPRVVNLESLNIRDLTPQTLGEKCDLAVSDLSFISQTYLYPVLPLILKEGGELVSLIKPQFEAGKGKVGKGGIVKDPKIHREVIKGLIKAAAECELYIRDLAPSPIRGGDGNTEFLAYFSYKVPFSFDNRKIETCIQAEAPDNR
ncbi:MAG: TlyA family RNA methyltransferase [Eubacteriales bacterium]